MDYCHLTAQEATALRHKRLRDLEGDHYWLRLTQEEMPDNPQVLADLTELERRIALHRDALGIVLPPDGVAPVPPDPRDTPRSGDVIAVPGPLCADPGCMTTATYEDNEHDNAEPQPEGLETKAVDPEYGTDTVVHTSETPDGGTPDQAEGGQEDADATPDGGVRDGDAEPAVCAPPI